MDPPTGITPYNATFSGNYTDLPPGHNVSYYFEYGPGPCATFPNSNTSMAPTPPGFIQNASASGSIPPVTVGELEPQSELCARLCVEDETAGGGYICSTNPTPFSTPKAPEVFTDPATNVGEDGSATLHGSYDSFVPGETLTYYHLYAPCDTYNASQQQTPSGTIPNNPGNGTLPPVVVPGLTSEVEYCTQACVVGVASNFGNPVCGSVNAFGWDAVVRVIDRVQTGRQARRQEGSVCQSQPHHSEV